MLSKNPDGFSGPCNPCRLQEWSGMSFCKKANIPKLHERKACNTIPSLEREGDHLHSRWWKMDNLRALGMDATKTAK